MFFSSNRCLSKGNDTDKELHYDMQEQHMLLHHLSRCCLMHMLLSLLRDAADAQEVSDTERACVSCVKSRKPQ